MEEAACCADIIKDKEIKRFYMRNNQTTLVSVVIPVYNVERFLEECVGSVLKQSFQNYEIILVDDGSNDNSSTLCDELQKRDNRISVIHRKNGGLSAARNTGLRAAKGEFVYFLDSDDWIKKETLKELVDTAKSDNADVVFFDAFVFFTDCEPDPNVYKYEREKKYETKTGQAQLIDLLETDEYRTAVPLMLFRRKYLIDNDIWFREGVLHEDELFTFLIYYANGTVAHCHEEYYARRMRAASIMTASSMLARYDSMYKIYFELSDMYGYGKIEGEAADLYLARIARSVIAKYKQLDEDSKRECEKSYKKFQKDVIKRKGFNDLKLKIKCSSGIRNAVYKFKKKQIEKGE